MLALSATLTASYPSLGEGTHTFQVRALDPVGNIDPTPASFEWSIDLTAPMTNLTDIGTWQNTLSFNVSWIATDNLTNIDHYDVQVKEGLGGWIDWLFSTTLTTASYTGQDTFNYNFRVRSADSVGNTSDWSPEITTTVDTTAPFASLIGVSQMVDGSFLVAWSGSDATSGVAVYDVEVQINEDEWQPWLSSVTETSTTYTAVPWNDYSYRVRAVDVAGNTGNWSEAVSTRSPGKIYIPLIPHSYQPQG